MGSGMEAKITGEEAALTDRVGLGAGDDPPKILAVRPLSLDKIRICLLIVLMFYFFLLAITFCTLWSTRAVTGSESDRRDTYSRSGNFLGQRRRRQQKKKRTRRSQWKKRYRFLRSDLIP
ncbi:unnamed protein product, partial [Ranitomeya imitator]